MKSIQPATHVVLTIDVEPDNAWENHQNPSVANVEQLLRLQALLARHGARATCLTTYRVCQNERAVEVLQELAAAGAEVGAHLHPWETPPVLESGLDTLFPVYPHELPLRLFERKIGELMETLTRRFEAPTSYRGGRWGLAAGHIAVLERSGIVVDSSVTPLIDWRSKPGLPRHLGGAGGVDYRLAPQEPYRPDYEDPLRAGSARLVEIPLTVSFTRRLPSVVRRHYGRLPELVQMALRKPRLLRPVWAVPPEQPTDDLRQMVRTLQAEAPPVINIALHSSELMLQGSPKSADARLLQRVFHNIEMLLGTLAEWPACRFCTLTEAAHAWQRRTHPLETSAPMTSRLSRE